LAVLDYCEFPAADSPWVAQQDGHSARLARAAERRRPVGERLCAAELSPRAQPTDGVPEPYRR
jgi:hypothetical protein